MPKKSQIQTQAPVSPLAQAPKPATFDPLDAPLFEAYEFHQSLADSVRADLYQRWYWADPVNWTRHEPPDWVFNLQWKEFRYSEVTDRDKLRQLLTENEPGVYFFTVKPNKLLDQVFPHYVFYVGISNEDGSNRPLRERLFDYLPTSISAIKKRKAIHKFLTLYYGQAWVRYAYVTNTSSELESAEMKLHGYLAPPVAERDFPPDMKAKKPAF
jgi:hypothetical protein